MRPAASVIVFTVSAGAGYGLLALTALSALGPFGSRSDFVATAVGVALALIVVGLLTSTLHLGQPFRAWRAFTQWRSSWLAREGIAALAGLPPAALFGALAGLKLSPAIATVAGLVAAILAAVTLFFTAMIYASLTPIARWKSRWTAPVFFALALMSGALLIAALSAIFALGWPMFDLLAAVMIAIAWALKALYWRDAREKSPRSTLAKTTGLESFGKARALWSQESPLTFVRSEMAPATKPGRESAARFVVHIALFALPLAFMVLTLIGPPQVRLLAPWGATFSAAVGLGVERWLFFAEARHVCRIYYD